MGQMAHREAPWKPSVAGVPSHTDCCASHVSILYPLGPNCCIMRGPRHILPHQTKTPALRHLAGTDSTRVLVRRREYHPRLLGPSTAQRQCHPCPHPGILQARDSVRPLPGNAEFGCLPRTLTISTTTIFVPSFGLWRMKADSCRTKALISSGSNQAIQNNSLLSSCLTPQKPRPCSPSRVASRALRSSAWKF